MTIMLANSNNSKSKSSSDVITNANNHCNTLDTENGAIIAFRNNNNGNSNGHISIGGKTLRTQQTSLANHVFHAEF